MLVERLRHHNSQAQRETLRQFGPRVWSMLTRMGLGIQDAEEVYQDVFLQVFRQIDTYDANKGSLMVWICHIAYHMSVSFLRRHRHTPKAVTFTEEELDGISAECTVEPLPTIPSDREELVVAAILQLSAEEQALIHFFYYDQLSINEIAVVTGSNASTVASRLRRTRMKLYTILKAQPS